MKLGIVIRSGSCKKNKLIRAFELMEYCQIEPYVCIAGMEEVGLLFSRSAKPSVPIWVCCHDLLSNQDVFIPLGKRGIRISRLKQYDKRKKPFWFRGMLLTGQYINGQTILRFMHGIGCERYLVLGRFLEIEENAHCLVWNMEQFEPDSEDSMRKAQEKLCNFFYFTSL